MKHFADDNYDSLAEYESHIGLNYEPNPEEHSILYREDYEYNPSIEEDGGISHFRD